MSGAEILFLIFAIATCGGALAVVLSQNVARMAFWLIVSLGSTSGLFFLLGADFVGATQLLIYVGGTVVLLIFGVMLTSSAPYLRIRTSPGELLLAGVVGLLLLSVIYSTVSFADWTKQLTLADSPPLSTGTGYNAAAEGNTARPIGLKLLGVSVSDVGSDHRQLSAGYLLPFEIVSVHLLVVLIGAAYLARAKRRVSVVETPRRQLASSPELEPSPSHAGSAH